MQLLAVLQKANPTFRRWLIKHGDDKFIDALAEVCHNYLEGNVKCTKDQAKGLRRYRRCMRNIVRSRVDLRRKRGKGAEGRNILLMKGDGFWLPLLYPIVADLATYFVSKALK